MNYSHVSHIHCWSQKQPPACGIPLEAHTQCCLCDLGTGEPMKQGKCCNRCANYIESPEITCSDAACTCHTAPVSKDTEPREEWADTQLDMMVRDFTEQGMMAKSEARTRFKTLIEHARTAAFDEVISALEGIQKQPFMVDDRGTKLYHAGTGDMQYSNAIDKAIRTVTDLRDRKDNV